MPLKGIKEIHLDSRNGNCYVVGEYEIKPVENGFSLTINKQKPMIFRNMKDLSKYLKNHPAW
jgi:hypothetical protein